jgi:hypothetical protein
MTDTWTIRLVLSRKQNARETVPPPPAEPDYLATDDGSRLITAGDAVGANIVTGD